MTDERERSRGWPRWRQQAILLLVGGVVGGAISAWDFSFPTVCAGPSPCIDYTGVATGVFWVVFGAQALLSTGFMLAAQRARHPFFLAHVATACTVICGLVVAQGFAARRLDEIRFRQHARTHFDVYAHEAISQPR